VLVVQTALQLSHLSMFSGRKGHIDLLLREARDRTQEMQSSAQSHL